MKLFNYILIFLVTISCSKKTFVPPIQQNIESISSEIILNSYNDKFKNIENKHLKIFSVVEAIINNKTYKLNAEIFFDPNNKILINFYYSGISMGKILISDTRIQGYEKISSSYIDENFVTIAKKFNFSTNEINFQNLNKLLLGRIFLPINPEDFNAIKIDTSFNLNRKLLIKDSFYLKEIKLNSVYQPKEIKLETNSNKTINLNYDWMENNLIYPKFLEITLAGSSVINLKINYRSSELLKEQPSFQIPNKYKKREL